MAFDPANLDTDRIYGIAELTDRFGLQRWEVARLVAKGILESPGTGTYVSQHFVPSEHDDLAVIALRCSQAVFHLHTAADLHGLSNRSYFGICLGVPASQRAPSIGRNFTSEITTTRWTRPHDHTVGVEERIIRKVTVRLTDQERTVCDMWRYSFHNPAFRVGSIRIMDEDLTHCVISYLKQNDGATGALAEMMDRLEAPRSSQEAFVQYLRTFSAGYAHERVF